MAAKLLATKLTHRVDGEAFAAGILHDIGKLILSASGRVEGNKELPSLIHLADFLCRRERIGDGGGECFPILDPASLRTFGIHEEPRAAIKRTSLTASIRRWRRQRLYQHRQQRRRGRRERTQ